MLRSIGINDRCPNVIEVTLAVLSVGSPPVDADLNAFRLKVIEIFQSALHDIICCPCEIPVDPYEPTPHSTYSMMKIPLLILCQIVLIENRVEFDLKMSGVDL